MHGKAGASSTQCPGQRCEVTLCCEGNPKCQAGACPTGYSEKPAVTDIVCQGAVCRDEDCCNSPSTCAAFTTCPSTRSLLVNAAGIQCAQLACAIDECCAPAPAVLPVDVDHAKVLPTTRLPKTATQTQIAGNDSDGVNGGMIAGVVVALLLVVAGAVVGFLYWRKKKMGVLEERLWHNHDSRVDNTELSVYVPPSLSPFSSSGKSSDSRNRQAAEQPQKNVSRMPKHHRQVTYGDGEFTSTPIALLARPYDGKASTSTARTIQNNKKPYDGKTSTSAARTNQTNKNSNARSGPSQDRRMAGGPQDAPDNNRI